MIMMLQVIEVGTTEQKMKNLQECKANLHVNKNLNFRDRRKLVKLIDTQLKELKNELEEEI